MSRILNENISDIGKRLKAARERVGLSQEELGQQLGIGRAAVANIEAGRSAIRVEHLLRLPEVLGQPVTFYLGSDSGLSEDEQKLLSTYRSLQRPVAMIA